jgi:hypothetical protein
MFCPNCGSVLKNDVHEATIYLNENNESEIIEINEKFENNPDCLGVCPICGEPIPYHLNDADLKKLNQVAHAKFHSERNRWNTGMCGLVGGSILLAIALIFFVLCFKVAENFRFSTSGEPFIVFVALSAISLFCFVFGSIYVAIANKRKKLYSTLIKKIQNKTFIQ